MSDSNVTVLLQAASSGDAQSLEALMNTIYRELHRMASGLLMGESEGHTLEPTALVNEAYMRLVSGETEWKSRAHFFGASARAMRRILVDHARSKSAQKRGGRAYRTTFEDLHVVTEDRHLDILALDQALQALGAVDERLLKVVELRYFAGLSVHQAAKLLGVSDATVKRDWTFARAWLFDYMDVGG